MSKCIILWPYTWKDVHFSSKFYKSATKACFRSSIFCKNRLTCHLWRLYHMRFLKYYAHCGSFCILEWKHEASTRFFVFSTIQWHSLSHSENRSKKYSIWATVPASLFKAEQAQLDIKHLYSLIRFNGFRIRSQLY